MGKNILGIKNCYGCGLCTVVCPKKLIHIKLNKNGFYEPVFDEPNYCNNCGLCYEVCSYSHQELSATPQFIKAFAGWSINNDVRESCSSGGVAYEIAKYLMDNGYKVLAARYNAEDNRVEHYIAQTTIELEQSKGSKYLQSYTEEALKKINKKEKYLVTGTPCQIDSFRRYIKRYKCEHNFVLLDFFCHGVPSKLMWDKYIRDKAKKTGNIRKVSWRNKTQGWHNSWNMKVEGASSTIESNLNSGDEFYTIFLSDTCLGKACYEKCKFKYEKSSADIRVGDLWGRKYIDDQKGVSAIVVYNSFAEDMIKNIKCIIKPHLFEEVAEDQTRENPKQSKTSYFIYSLLRKRFVNTKMLVKTLRLSNIIDSIFYHLFNPVVTLDLIKKIIGTK